MIPRDLHFLQSSFIYFDLAIFFFLVLTYIAYKKNLYGLKQFSQNSSIKLVSPAVKESLFVLGWVLLILALMRPVGNENYQNSKESIQKGKVKSGLNLYFIIDASQSMGVKDMRGGRSRLEIAKETVDFLLSQLKGDEASLITFTSKMNVAAPLSFDYPFERIILREIQLNEGDSYGTDYIDLLTELKEESEPFQHKVFYLFTDGGDNQKLDDNQLLSLAKDLKGPLITVGIGTLEGGTVPDVLLNGQPVISKLDVRPLKLLSEGTGGSYFYADSFTTSDLASILRSSLNEIPLTMSSTAMTETIFSDYFQIPLGFAILIFLIYPFIPTIKKMAFVFLIFFLPLTGYAEDIGEKLFAQKQYQEAIAWYRRELGDFPSKEIGNKIFYNIALSYALEEDWDEAKSASFFIKLNENTPIFNRSVNALKNVLIKEATSITDPVESLAMQNLELLSSLNGIKEQDALIIKQLLQKFELLYLAILDRQKTMLLNDQCNCQLWEQVVPLFGDGLNMIRRNTEWNNIIYTYLKWSQAYALLKNPPSPSNQQQMNDFNELQEMQTLDQTPKEKKNIPQQGIPW